MDVERDDEQAYSLYSQPYKRRATLKTVDDDALGSDSVAKYYKGSAFCVGTVSQYCPSIDQHLVLFDELVLQPQWVSCNRSTVDLLAGYPASAAVLPPPRPKTLIFEEGEESIRANSICMVCELRLDADQLSCSTCARNCHRRCLPPLKFPAPVAPSMTPTVGRKKTNALRASALTTWTCWSCVGNKYFMWLVIYFRFSPEFVIDHSMLGVQNQPVGPTFNVVEHKPHSTPQCCHLLRRAA